MVFIIIAKYILNVSLGWFGLMVLLQNTLEKEFFSLFMDALPSKYAMWMGGLYLAIIVAQRGLKFYHDFQMKSMERKEKREQLKNK